MLWTRGSWEETRYLDLTREVGAGRAENKELARDLRSSRRTVVAYSSGSMRSRVARRCCRRSLWLAERVEQVSRSWSTPRLTAVR